MKKLVVITSLLIALGASTASAAGVNLAWNACLSGGGAHSKTFSCGTNTGTNSLISSVRAPAGINQWTAFEAEFYFEFGVTQPAWWQLRNGTGQVGQCRSGALSANALPPAGGGCIDPYQGQGAGGIGAYQNAPSGNTTRARLLLVFAIPAGTEVPLTPEEEYFVATVNITNAKSTGLGACTGCSQPACITLMYVKVVQPAGAPGGDVNVSNQAESRTALWQTTSDAGCLLTPTRRATWGAVKSLYR